MYQVKFEGLTSVLERIVGIFWPNDFLRRISRWRVAGSWFGIYQQIFWYIVPKILGYSCDWFIQSQKDSSSLHRNKHIFLIQEKRLFNNKLHFQQFFPQNQGWWGRGTWAWGLKFLRIKCRKEKAQVSIFGVNHFL